MNERAFKGRSLFPDFRGALAFFDLAGTLLETDQRLFEERSDMLRRFAAVAGMFVLVTGQPSDDHQVQAICNLLLAVEDCRFVAYVTRGGRRLVKQGSELKADVDYLSRTVLENDVQQILLDHVGRLLQSQNLKPIIPVRCIDDVAIRINLPPAGRPAFIEALRNHLDGAGLFDSLCSMTPVELQVVAEGRTSVFVMRRGAGKRMAVEYELAEFAKRIGPAAAYYFGNEFHPSGNDHEVLGVAGVNVMALDRDELPPTNAVARRIGRTPADLHRFLDCALAPLPVIFVSFGGTKLGVGGLAADGRYLGESELYWRTIDRFADCLEDSTADRFCSELMTEVDRFLTKHGFTWRDVGLIGMGFPGPCEVDLWFSNNLTRAFRSGVPLVECTSKAIRACAGHALPVQVTFDAHCDAGGELYHRQGLLRRDGDTTIDAATVLNIATGIACAYVKAGRVLIGDDDFRRHVGASFDGGAGQIGRHLWFHPLENRWKYHYLPRGQTPRVDSAIRLTEYLSGPALAARLLMLLWRSDALCFADFDCFDSDSLQRIQKLREQLGSSRDLVALSQWVRGEGQAVSTAMLRWADGVYQDPQANPASTCVTQFAEQVARDLAGALNAWSAVPEWRPFLHRVVLTGGVGIRFLASAEESERSFLSLLRPHLHADIHVERSVLQDSVERGAYLFACQPVCGADLRGDC